MRLTDFSPGANVSYEKSKIMRTYRSVKRRMQSRFMRDGQLSAKLFLVSSKKSDQDFIEQYVETVKDSLDCAKDILAEAVSDEAAYRSWIRKRTMQKGTLISTAKDEKQESVYEMYYEFEEALSKLAGHRILALNRGEKEKFLTVKVEAPQDDILRYLEKQIIRTDNPYTTPVLQ